MINSFVAILIAIAANAIIVAGIVTLVMGRRARLAPASEQVAMLGERLDARLEEMRSAIDSIAVEVERIAEAQRYLLLDRPGANSLADGRPSAGRSLTPH
ncbi:MAG: hypothetical protein ABJE10_16420 [bacterium]